MFQVLEIPQLIQSPNAVLQLLGAENAAFDEAHLAADHVVAGGVVAGEGDSVDEVLLALGHPHRDVHGGLSRTGHRTLGRVLEVHVRETGEFEVPAAAVQLPGFFETLADVLLGVPLPRFQLEERVQKLGVDDLVAIKLDVANPVAMALSDWDPQLHPARFLVLGVFQRLDLGRADARLNVALLAIELLDLVGVLLELLLLIRPAARNKRQEPVLLGFLHPALEGAVADLVVADELDVANLDLRTFVDVEDHLGQLRSAGEFFDARFHLGKLVTLLRHQISKNPLDAPNRALIEERIEPERDPRLLHLLVDLGPIDFVAGDVLDDLDPRPFLHVEDDVLAGHAIEVAIEDLNPQVV